MCHWQTLYWYFNWRLKNLNRICGSFSIESSQVYLVRKKVFQKSFLLLSEDSPPKIVNKKVEKKSDSYQNFLHFSQKPVFCPKDRVVHNISPPPP